MATPPDGLDIEQPDALVAYLHTSGRIPPGEQPAVRRLSGGVSNRTVLVERPGGAHWVIKQALPKLRVAVDWFCSPERIEREAAGIEWLTRLAPPGTIPPLVFLDRAQHLLAMHAVPEPHAVWKTLLLAGEVQACHVEQFARLLGTIHRASSQQEREVAPAFEDRSFFEGLRLEPYYLYTAGQAPAAADFYDDLVAATRRHRHALTHGDYSPKNVLVHAGRLILLDHEVIHFGDPAFDLGFSLTHLLSKAHHMEARRARFGEAALAYWQVYYATLGDLPWAGELEPRAVRHTLGCLLARVAGRSPLEYLSPSERDRQRALVLRIMTHPPAEMAELIRQFLAGLES